jgi:hypothetical protein
MSICTPIGNCGAFNLISALSFAHWAGADATSTNCTCHGLTLQNERETNDSGEPETTHHNCESIKVTFYDRGTAVVGRDSATKEIGESRALALVEQNQEDHHDARDYEKD